MLEHIIQQMETERGLDRAAAIAHMRFDFIEKICDSSVIKPRESKEHLRSVKMDKILTGKYTAIPCFAGIMGLVFYLTFGVIGSFLSDLLDSGITLTGAGSVSHKQALEKAKSEYRKYQEITLTPVEKHILKALKRFPRK